MTEASNAGTAHAGREKDNNMVSFRNRIFFHNLSSRRQLRRHLACLMLLSAAVLITPGAQAQQWRTASDKDGIRMETRHVPGARLDELRVSTSLKASPDTIADYLFGKYLDEKNKNLRRTFIQRGRDLTIWSDVLTTPVTSERCYSMRFERHGHASGEIRVKFASLDYVGKKPNPDCVALRTRGEWVMAPTNTGTQLTYVSLTDFGGKVPAALARRSLSAAAISSLRKVAAGASGLPLPCGIGD